ncbi:MULTISPECIES: MBL fold metallo-hydrolase [unclassified Rathayibacter]|uniref:MBL fold metallo-hydrolase n=1 Tax=unclassified Rathayibacter TaxID=2609250 RepID=UPI001051A948|nr:MULTISPECIES: MBL fold metallo-hydrolase [unclassified Rathayibacter]TCL79396.1 metallo-beta-lactamase superfamily protein [Rathayibacter sp. PhB192]TCM25336.1 metallo-beta-lactamase superfamily protein [Rathayibacter sp. PhB179]
MALSTHDLVQTPFEELLATPSSRLPYQHDVQLRFFVLQRPDDTVIVYNSPGVSEAATAIQRLGPPSRLLVNHAHEAMYGPPDLDIPIWMHGADRREVGDSLDIAGTFDRRERIDHDLEAIPTPGHTPGTCSYLWDSGTHRFFFTGDFLWIENGEWKAVVLDPALRDEHLASLALIGGMAARLDREALSDERRYPARAGEFVHLRDATGTRHRTPSTRRKGLVQNMPVRHQKRSTNPQPQSCGIDDVETV